MIENRRVTVVLPAYNAARTLERTVSEIPRDLVDDIILTDDASRDDTVAVARSLGLESAFTPAVADYWDRLSARPAFERAKAAQSEAEPVI